MNSNRKSLTTKIEKNRIDDEKRRKSLQEKVKAKDTQKRLIRNALSDNTEGERVNKKIVFDTEVSGEDEEKDDSPPNKKFKKTEESLKLFNDSDNDDPIVDIKVQHQFKGEGGKKLLDLQATYNNDERFKIDQRFYNSDDDDDDDDNDDEDKEKKSKDADHSSNSVDDEKKKQFEILEQVLGHPVKPKTVKEKSSLDDMPRFDPMNEDHSKYEVEKEEKKLSKSRKRELRELKKSQRLKQNSNEEPEAEPDPAKKVVSQDKFYQVSENIKETFKVQGNEGASFSLLSAYGRTTERNDKGSNDEEVNTKNVRKPEDETGSPQPTNVLGKSQSNEQAITASGIWKESFFFSDNDPRIKEGLSFMNKKNSEEAKAAAEKFSLKRNDMRTALQRQVKKHIQMRNPFKKKVGGMKNGPQSRNQHQRNKNFDRNKNYMNTFKRRN